MARFELTDQLAVTSPLNKITIEKVGNDLFLNIKLKMKESQKHPDESLPDSDPKKQAAMARADENYRETLQNPNDNLLNGKHTIEIRKVYLENDPADSILKLSANIMTKIPHTGFGIRDKSRKK